MPGEVTVDSGIDELRAEVDEAIDFCSRVAGREFQMNVIRAGRLTLGSVEDEAANAAVVGRLEPHVVVAGLHDRVAGDG